MSTLNVLRLLNAMYLDGDNVLVILSLDTEGHILCAGTTLPTDADEGYCPGCIFIHTDGTDGSALYVNEGTKASADFNLITVASA